MKSIRSYLKKIISVLLLFLSGLLVAVYLYIGKAFKDASFEQLIYSLLHADGTSFDAIWEGLLYGSIILIVFSIIIYFPFYVNSKTSNYIHLKIGKIKKNIQIWPLSWKYLFIYSILIFCLCFYVTLDGLGGVVYINNQLNSSSLFEDYYVNPRDVNLSIDGDKKNLIYIFVESLETTSTSVGNGGAMNTSIIPNMEKLALENINFSNSNNLGGALQISNVGWTISGMVAQTAGIPLKLQIEGNNYIGYSKYLQGAYSLGEVLEDNGYKNYIMMGSDAFFAGRNEYFIQHGNYDILDYNWALREKLIPADYHEWWGYEDSKLFEFAKNKLLEISKKEEYFNFSMLTADTHFTDGYIDKRCTSLPFDGHYANSFYCCDMMLYQFISWLKEQDFYKDTVIVIVGDHLTMQYNFYDDIDPNYQRVVYNTFINSSLTEGNFKNRLFSTVDLYPTTLAAMGFNIPGNRLGLGTNLFSNKKTLIEELGFDNLNSEIEKNSKFYNKYILGDSYYEMYKDIKKEESE